MLPNPSFDSLTTHMPFRNQSKVLLHGENSGELNLNESRVGDDKISSKMAKFDYSSACQKCVEIRPYKITIFSNKMKWHLMISIAST